MTDSLRGQALSASLTVKDLEKSVAWYRDVLGFVVEQQYERNGTPGGASMSAGDVRLLLNQDDGARGADRVKGEGFSLMITTAQDIDAVARSITAAGGTLDMEPVDTPWGARIFRLHDPDGFRFAISSPRS
jgi:uncharacterized glyoxalase superfamily protein PhnB